MNFMKAAIEACLRGPVPGQPDIKTEIADLLARKDAGAFYQYSKDRYQAYTQNFLTITAGLSGRF